MLSLIPIFILTTVKYHRLVMVMRVNEIHTKELTKGKSNGTKFWQKCQRCSFNFLNLLQGRKIQYYLEHTINNSNAYQCKKNKVWRLGFSNRKRKFVINDNGYCQVPGLCKNGIRYEKHSYISWNEMNFW